MRYKVPYPDGWIVTDDKAIASLAATDAAAAARIKGRITLMQQNPLRFFKPHGGQLPFLNNRSKELLLLKAPNQVGKSVSLIAWLLYWCAPTKPEWECFTEFGIDWQEWQGPQEVGVASYSWKHIQRNIWPKMVDMLPIDEIAHLVKKDTPENMIRARCKAMNVSNSQIVYLGCGSAVQFYCYTQADAAYESVTLSRWAFDEQVPEEQFDGAYARLTTADNYQMAMGYTPHVVDDRPDTGAGHWATDLLSGTRDKGLKYEIYTISMDDVPDVIIGAEKKLQLYERYIAEPTREGDMRSLRKGRARYYGEVEASGGLVYEAWEPALHIIDPFEIPATWPRYRAVDPGYKHPCGALWAALSPWGDCVLYREYYKVGLGIGDNVLGIVEAGGNALKAEGQIEVDKGVLIMRSSEDLARERYEDTVLDPRCFAKPSSFTNVTLGDQWRIMGLDCRAGDPRHNKHAVPICREWFEPVRGRTHILVNMKLRDDLIDIDGTPLTRAPRLYVFNTLQHFRWEIERYASKNAIDEPVDKDDHLMTTMKYLLLNMPTITPAHVIEAPEMTPVPLSGDVARRIRISEERKRRQSRHIVRKRGRGR